MSARGPHEEADDLLVDLLIKQATEELLPVERERLATYDPVLVASRRREIEEALSAVLTLPAASAGQPPPGLLDRIEAQGIAEMGTAPRRAQAASASVAPLSSPSVTPRSPRWLGNGWLAAAACLVLAVMGWLRHPRVEAPRAEQLPAVTERSPVQQAPVIEQTPVAEPPVVPTAEQERATLMARADTLKLNLQSTKDPLAKGVSADAVWDPVTQKGFLHLVGFKANDPLKRQYQAWIIDATRDKRFPVDGGVFDVSPEVTEIVVPLKAKLAVGRAAAIAVTEETAGGVVVSSLAHVVVISKAG